MLAIMDVPGKTVKLPAGTQTLSQRLWGVDWGLPSCKGDTRIELSCFDEIAPFLAREAEEMFGVNEARHWLHEPMSPAKLLFLRESDVFAFRSGDELVGYALGQPSDWSTYYIRSMGVLRSNQGRGLVAAVERVLAAALAPAGVHRIEADTAADNTAMAFAFMRCGWVATGFTNSDRWGAMVRYTRYLSEEATAAFRNQFCLDVRPRRRAGQRS